MDDQASKKPASEATDDGRDGTATAPISTSDDVTSSPQAQPFTQRKYFVITPQLVWALSRDPYDLALWYTVRMVAGESGECFLNTEQLGQLAMMSTGKVSQCRKYLLDVGLLEGELRRDPDYPQPVWHLTTPDLWEANLQWRHLIGDSLLGRIDWKSKWAESESLHHVKALSDVKSLHQVKASPDEEGPSPGEAKKNQKKNHQGEDGGGQSNGKAIELLLSFGISEPVARDLAAVCEVDQVEGWVTYARDAQSLRDPAALVVARLRAGEPAPRPKNKPGLKTDSPDHRQRYISGEFADLIEH